MKMQLLCRVQNYRVRYYCSKAVRNKFPAEIIIGNKHYPTDEWTNCSPKIQSYIGRNIYLQKNHPLSIVREQIVNYFYRIFKTNRGNPTFSVLDNICPVVSTHQNFDSLLIPKDHVSRRKGDNYYLNKDYLLRAHCTAHQADAIKSGLNNFLIVGDVYRRDEIDRSHHAVFHQIDGVRTLHRDKLFTNNADLQIFESQNYEKLIIDESSSSCADAKKQPCHTLEAVKLIEHELQTVLVGLVKELFGNDVTYRWVDAYFPFTQPSWELEIKSKKHSAKWMEVLGCGIMRNEILKMNGVDNSIGWAFGLGLERLAMHLYGIDDIRLFWTKDSGFLNQFDEKKSTNEMQYKPISKYNQLYMDTSFWLPDEHTIDSFPINDIYEIIREAGGDLVEQVKSI